MDNLGHAQDVLQAQVPLPGQLDLRGWEWRYPWQQARGSTPGVIRDTGEALNTLAVSADGKWLAAAMYFGGEVIVWNRTTNERTRIPVGDAHARAVFSPSEPLLAISMTRAGQRFGIGRKERSSPN